MNIKEELKRAVVRDQRIHMSSNLSQSELEQVANFLQYHFNKGDLPHWRPIAFTYHHAEDTFMRATQKSNVILGDTAQRIADRISNKVPVGEFYVPPKDVWGYTQLNDTSKMSNEWADTFGFAVGDLTHGVGVKVPARRRDILMDDASLYNIAFCRDCIREGVETEVYTVEQYEVPTADTNARFSHYGVNTEELRPICTTKDPLHEYNQFRVDLMRGFGMGCPRPVFLILYKYGSSPRTSVQNSHEVIPELRSSFVFCNTNYKLSHLVKVEGIQNNVINIEYWGSDYTDSQLTALFRNM